MKKIYFFIVACLTLLSCQDKHSSEVSPSRDGSCVIQTRDFRGVATLLSTKVPKDTTIYEFEIFDNFIPEGDTLFTGEAVFHREGNNIVENVYDCDHNLLLTHVYNDFGCVSITEYIDEETLGISLSPSSINGYRQRGERYSACVLRVTDEFYREDCGSFTDAYLGGVKWAISHYMGVIGCSRYVDQSL